MSTLLALRSHPGSIVAIDTTTGDHEVVLADAGNSPDGIVVVDSTIYWTTMGLPRQSPHISGEAGRDYSTADGGLHAVDLDGTGRRDILPTGSLTTGKQLTSDGQWLYWADREGCKVSCCRPDGSGLRDLLIRRPVADRLGECVGVALDPIAGKFYWTQKGPAKGGRGRIFRAPLTPGEDPKSRTDVEVLWEGLPEPIDLELAGGYLYWTDRGGEPDGNTLNRAPVPELGRPGGAPEILARGFHEAIGLALDSHQAVTYVSDLGGTIREVPLPGADREERTLTRLDGPVTGLALRLPGS